MLRVGNFDMKARILVLIAFQMTLGCKIQCILGNSPCTNEWQTETKRTCTAALKLSNVALPVVMSLRVVAQEIMFSTPPSHWSSLGVRKSSSIPQIACQSNLFNDQKIQKCGIEELSDQICSITLPDDQQTRFDLSWHTDETVGGALKEAVGLATVTSQGVPETKMTLNSLGRDPSYYGEGTARLYRSEARTLHFTEIPITVRYTQTLNDGVNRGNESEDGKRYSFSCGAADFITNSINQAGSSRDPAAFQESCRFSLLGQHTVVVIPNSDGIRAQLLSDQGTLLQEVSSQACQ